MNTTVPTDQPQRDRADYSAIAVELHRIADVFAKLPPDVAGSPHSSVQLAIMPADTAEAVDAIGMALFGKTGETIQVPGGRTGWRRKVDGSPAGMWVSIHAEIPGPPDERDAELVQLRAENERLRAAAPSFVDDDPTGLGFSREADDPTPTTAVPATIEGHAEFSGRAAVPDVTLCLAEVEPATTCDEPIWWNAGANAWWHQSDEHFNHTATGPSIPPSDGGE